MVDNVGGLEGRYKWQAKNGRPGRGASCLEKHSLYRTASEIDAYISRPAPSSSDAVLVFEGVVGRRETRGTNSWCVENKWQLGWLPTARLGAGGIKNGAAQVEAGEEGCGPDL